jgi:hypothetical protein
MRGGDRDEETEPDPAPFKFGPYQLASLVDTKNLGALETLGGIIGLLAGLGVDPNSGLLIVERPSESEDPPANVQEGRSKPRNNTLTKAPPSPVPSRTGNGFMVPTFFPFEEAGLSSD